MIYFDHTATTPLHPEVQQSIHDVMGRFYGNPSSLHRIGVEAEHLLTRARQQVADLLQVPASTVIFTSGGTESNNLAIKGTLMKHQGRGRHLITTAVEHASVYEVYRQLETQGYEITVLPVDQDGRVDPAQVEQAIRNDTVLVSIMYVNNEVGTIQPIEQIASVLAKYPKVLFHVDAVQAFGKIPVYPVKLGVDLMTISAHKVYGPKGAGVLYKREGLRLSPLLAGGGQEGGYRSGTENVPLIVGMAKAFRLAVSNQRDGQAIVRDLRARFIGRLASASAVTFNTPLEETFAVPHIVNLSCVGVRSEVIVHALEERGFYISSRSACSSREDKPSRVLLALGLSEDRAASGLRISIAKEHTQEQIDELAHALAQVTTQLKAILKS